MGDEVSAFRHALWQATIANRYGNQIAAEVGNAHEYPRDLWVAYTDETTFNSIQAADDKVDLLNNRQGRSIAGTLPKNAGMRDVAGAVLESYYKVGLWTATQNKSGNWEINQTRLSNIKYQQMKAALANKDNNAEWIKKQP